MCSSGVTSYCFSSEVHGFVDLRVGKGRRRVSGNLLKIGVVVQKEKMKIQCDVCEKAPATVICCADEAALCAKCDVEVHAANKLASKHQRLLLQCLSTKLPKCDICQVITISVASPWYIALSFASFVDLRVFVLI